MSVLFSSISLFIYLQSNCYAQKWTVNDDWRVFTIESFVTAEHTFVKFFESSSHEKLFEF